ncbi:GNAT family N-acetyltransferase [Gordonia polyisoprenivorans]|uniref:GNAT family N-acetyltransferase n=1 Tax=Gordonia polyisoprenivorans TaxID=84595 RepID=UPI002301A8FB|nr:GNAT family N-acetyltransferase [Gordonia polyisoprenivorans]WCB35340.1 GNAT family N-acetyltransferase [Gordonia polyisoprenivorans]
MADTTVVPTRDLDVTSSLLAQAFIDDPVTRWIAPDPRGDVQMFRTLVRWTHRSDVAPDLAVRAGEPVGVAVWDPPGYRVSRLDEIRALVGFVRSLRSGIRRGAVVESTFARLRPEEPHWYLGQLGAIRHGEGIGTALLEAGIARVDGPAYLESSNVANIPLYERFGFEVVREVRLPGGPSVWPMFRKG